MPNPPLPDPILVTRPAALQRLVDDLLAQPIIAVDTESNSLYAYREQVCLVQFSHPQVDYLVDPLALDDLSILDEIFTNPSIEKVFHAAEYDLICLKRDFGFEFENLFDTMLSARILGIEGVGLSTLLEQEFGIRLDKRYQRANWGQRPLPTHLLNYARLDTRYLIALRHRLAKQLEQRGLWPLADEDFKRMRSINGKNPDERLDDPWRIHGAQDLSPQKAAVLNELCRYRDEVARALDRPLFKVLGDKTLLEVAQSLPHSQAELEGLSGMTVRQMERHGRGLLEAVAVGLKAPPVHPPRHVRPNDSFLQRLDALREWRKHTARSMGVPSDVVLPRDLMHAIAERAPGSPSELRAVLHAAPWRFERFARPILDVLAAV